MLSYWEQKDLIPDVDIVIIGAGIVGLTTARILAERQPQLNVAILEAQTVGAAASSRNAGFACFGSVSEILADIRHYDIDQVKAIIDLRRKGLKRLISRYGAASLTLELCGGYEVFRDTSTFENFASSISEINRLIGEEIFKIAKTERSTRFYKNCILNDQEGHLDTGKMYKCLYDDAISHKVRIYNGLRATKIESGAKAVEIVLEGGGKIKCSQVVVTTNALTREILPGIEVIPCRNQVIVTHPIPNHKIRGTYHMDEGYVYFRDIGARILIGGGRNKFPEEETDKFGINNSNVDYLIQILKTLVIPDVHQIKVDYQWSGILSGGSNRMPIVKRIDDRITVAVRLGGMGVAIGSIIGEQTATLVLQ